MNKLGHSIVLIVRFTVYSQSSYIVRHTPFVACYSIGVPFVRVFYIQMKGSYKYTRFHRNVLQFSDAGCRMWSAPESEYVLYIYVRVDHTIFLAPLCTFI